MKKLLLLAPIGMMLMTSCASKEEKIKTRLTELETQIDSLEIYLSEVNTEQLTKENVLRKKMNKFYKPGGGYYNLDSLDYFDNKLDSLKDDIVYNQKYHGLKGQIRELSKEKQALEIKLMEIKVNNI